MKSECWFDPARERQHFQWISSLGEIRYDERPAIRLAAF
jgi:hypothetical protein